MPDYLFLENRTGATPRVLQYTGATPTQLGSTFGTVITPINPGRQCMRNMVARVGNNVYAMLWDGVYKLQGDLTTWSKASIDGGLTFTSPAAADDIRIVQSGLYPVVISGVPNIAGFYSTATAGTWRGFKLNLNTGVWSEGVAQVVPAATGVVGTNGGFTAGIVFRGVIHGFGDDGATNWRGFSYDPSSDSYSSIAFSTNAPFTHANTIGNAPDTCVYNDRLYAIANYGSGSTRLSLYEFSGGLWTNLAIGITPGGASGISGGQILLFTDGTSMYGMQIGSGPAWNCQKWGSSIGAPTDISTTVLPVALRTAGTPAPARWNKITDVETNPLSPAIKLFYAANGTAGTVQNMYNWNGDGMVIGAAGSPNDSGGNIAHALVNDPRAGGERSWTSGQLDATIRSRTAVLGGEQITFRLQGGGTGRKFKLYYTDESEQALLEATLVAPVTGGVATLNVGLNRVEGIDANDATDYTIVWDLAADGVANGTRVTRFPQAIA